MFSLYFKYDKYIYFILHQLFMLVKYMNYKELNKLYRKILTNNQLFSLI